MKVSFTVNGRPVKVEVEPHKTLLDILRGPLELTGAREGCSLGECGACTVLMNGKPVVSCLVLAPDAEGTQVITVEGLAQGDRLDPVQDAFVRHGAIQCGFCTPGMIMTAKGQEPLEGNLCRCTGYAKILEAVKAGREGAAS